MKINYDRAVFRETNEVGHRAIVRDNEGRVLASLAKKIPLPQSVVDVEVTAARRALILAKELQFYSIVLEGDSAIITRALQAEELSLASFGNIIEEAQSYAKTFHSFKVNHINQRGNSVTHKLARHARHISGLVVWMEEIPPHLISILLAYHG